MKTAADLRMLAGRIFNPSEQDEFGVLLRLEDGLGRALEFITDRITQDHELGRIDDQQAEEYFRILIV